MKILIAVLLLWTTIAAFVFGMGFHNVDLAYNNKGFNDCNSFNCVSMDERYSSGLDGMLIGFGMFFVTIFGLTIKGDKILR